jgi:hypothetical protein
MPATFTFMIVLLAATVANAFPAGNETVGVGGCKGCSGSGCICENAVSISQPWALHFKEMFEQGRYKVTKYNPVWTELGCDNTGGPGVMHCTQTLDVGYEKSKSTTITNSWTVSMQAAFRGLGGSASFTQAVSHYSEASFSTHSTTGVTYDVPPNEFVTIYQRIMQVELELTSAPQIRVDGNEGPRDVSIHGNQLWFDNPYGGPTCQCNDNHLTHVQLGFITDCYTVSPDPKARDAHCP